MVKYVSWKLSEFIWSLFDWGLNLNKIQIQIVYQNLSSNNWKTLTSLPGLSLPELTRQPNWPSRPTEPHNQPAGGLFIFFSSSGKRDPLASLPSFFLLTFSPFRLTPCRAPPRRTSTRAMGRASRRLARMPSQGAPVHTPRGLPREKRPLYPLPATPKALALPPILLVSQYNQLDPCCARLCFGFGVLWTWH
jgi:hypothetical protein